MSATQSISSIQTGKRARLSRISAMFLLSLSTGIAWRWMVADAPLHVYSVSANGGVGPNAAHFYRVADEAAYVGDVSWNSLLTLPLHEKENLVRKNSVSLRLAREGFAYPFLTGKAEWRVSLDGSGEWWAVNAGRMLLLTRLFICESDVYAAKKDYVKALNSAFDAIRMGQDNAKSPIGMGSAFRTQLSAEERVSKSIDFLTAAEARKGISRLTGIMASRQSFADHKRKERDFVKDSLLMMSAIPSQTFLSSLASHSETKPAPLFGVVYLGWVFYYGKEGMYRTYDRYMNEVIRRLDQPFQKARQAGTVAKPQNPLLKNWLSDYDTALLESTQVEAGNQILLARLAIQAYKQEHQGNLPTDLNALTQGNHPCLNSIPTDPFSTDGKAPLRYRNETVYSVGVNGIDDGGSGDDTLTISSHE